MSIRRMMFSCSKNSNRKAKSGSDLKQGCSEVLTEDFDFAQYTACVPDVVKGILNLFDGHLFLGLVVLCREDDAVGTAADHVRRFVALVDNDLLAADFKLMLSFHSRWVELLCLCLMSLKRAGFILLLLLLSGGNLLLTLCLVRTLRITLSKILHCLVALLLLLSSLLILVDFCHYQL